MSSFPQILRTVKSEYFKKPTKQGGIYALNININPACNTVQPEQYFSAKQSKAAQTIVDNSNTVPNRHQRNLSLVNFRRQIFSSQTQRRPVSRAVESRLSIREPKKQDNKKYVKQKLSTYAIPQSAQTKLEQSDSLSRRLDEGIQTALKLDERFFEIVVMKHETLLKIKRMYDKIDDQMQKLRNQASLEFKKLRKTISDSRRNSQMGLKVNKLETAKLQQQFDSISSTANSLDHRGYKIYQTCNNSL